MKEFKKILFPLDLSEASHQIVPFVISLAHKYNAEVHLLFVSATFSQYATFFIPHPSLDRFEEELAKSAERKLIEFTEQHLGGLLHMKKMVLIGDPAEKILEYIKSEMIDLVVIGTHGRKGLDRMLFGSVAEEVVKTSPVPVLSVNPYRKL